MRKTRFLKKAGFPQNPFLSSADERKLVAITDTVTLSAAFLAGLASFLSPCTIPLIPSYLSFVTGVSLKEADASLPARRRVSLVLNSVLFIAGFSLVFIALGAAASSVGDLLREYQVWIERVGGVIVILLGLHLMGLLRVGALQRDMRLQLQDRPAGYLGAVIIGAVFAAGWSPCVGPILAPILLIASQLDTVGKGVILLTAYSAGLALPFLAAALLMGEALLRVVRRASRYAPTIERIAGGVLVLFGLLLVFGKMSWLSAWLPRIGF